MSDVSGRSGLPFHLATTELGEALAAPGGAEVAREMHARMRKGRTRLSNARDVPETLRQSVADILAAIDLALVILEELPTEKERNPHD